VAVARRPEPRPGAHFGHGQGGEAGAPGAAAVARRALRLMPHPRLILGTRVAPFPACFDPDFLQRYAAATQDPSPRVRAGEAVPPVAIVTTIWDAQTRGRSRLVPETLQRSASGGVHGEHDVVLHRPIVPGEPLRIWVEGHGARPAARNSLVTLRYVALDLDDALVAEQWWTTVYLGTTCQPTGEPAPEHAFPEAARKRPVGSYVVECEDELRRR